MRTPLPMNGRSLTTNPNQTALSENKRVDGGKESLAVARHVIADDDLLRAGPGLCLINRNSTFEGGVQNMRAHQIRR